MSYLLRGFGCQGGNQSADEPDEEYRRKLREKLNERWDAFIILVNDPKYLPESEVSKLESVVEEKR